jgi:RNA polymerase sigma-70 factor (ECF subfamily)
VSTSGPAPDWREIAVRVHGGDPAAEEEVASFFARPIRALALMSVRDRTHAEEVVQDTLLAVICALRDGRVHHTEQLPEFVRGTARNLIQDRVRKRVRERLSPLPPDETLPHPAVDQEDFERLYAAEQAIGTLNPHERAVLMLSLVEGMGPDEVARRLKVSPEAVRQRKSRALRRLSELLKPVSQTPGPGLLKE